MKAVYYVYEHWRPDKEEPFYVGKGKGGRAYDTGRNSYYERVVRKLASLGLCVEVRLIVGELTEPEAYALEIERIALRRSQGYQLVNMTNGGEGFSDPTGEIRKKISASLTGKPTGRVTNPRGFADWIKANGVPEVTREAVRRSNANRVDSADTRYRKGSATRGKKRPHSESTKIKISQANSNPSEETRLKMSESAKLRERTSEFEEKRIAPLRGQRWITDGYNNKKIKPGALPPEGWVFGMTNWRQPHEVAIQEELE